MSRMGTKALADGAPKVCANSMASTVVVDMLLETLIVTDEAKDGPADSSSDSRHPSHKQIGHSRSGRVGSRLVAN